MTAWDHHEVGVVHAWTWVRGHHEAGTLPLFVNHADVQAAFGCSARTVYRWRAEGRLPGGQLGPQCVWRCWRPVFVHWLGLQVDDAIEQAWNAPTHHVVYPVPYVATMVRVSVPTVRAWIREGLLATHDDVSVVSSVTLREVFGKTAPVVPAWHGWAADVRHATSLALQPQRATPADTGGTLCYHLAAGGS